MLLLLATYSISHMAGHRSSLGSSYMVRHVPAKDIMSHNTSNAQLGTRLRQLARSERPGGELEQTTRILKSMAHPMRLKLLCTIGDNEFCVKELLDRVGTSQTNVTQHLNVLLIGGLISRRRVGHCHYYRIHDNHTLEFIHRVREVFCPNRNQPH